MTKQKFKKILIVLPVISALVLFNISPVLAISIPSPSKVASDIEKRYHFNLQEIQNIGESFNVSDTKKTTPQVMLFFSPSDPKPGEKLTAQATPMYFSNANKNLYYTWYLKHKDCDLDNDPNKSERDLCDRDDDGKITVNDWKIEAMRIVTNSDFDTKKADYSNDNDNDGYKVNWGGNEREDMPNYCYVHDFQNGINYELNDSSDITFDCPSGTTAKCVENEDLACSDNIGGSFTEYQVCQDLGETPVCSNGTASCNNGTPACVDTITEYDCDSPPASYSAASCSTLFGSSDISCSNSSGSSGPGTNKCKHLFPLYKNFDGCIDFMGTPDKSSDDFCIDLDDKELGDGNFKEEEEAFWRTSPQDPDTADNGNGDEANAVGLGRNEFAWTYFEGDAVGVVVEGVAMIPTKHANSSMMIMWALPKNDCTVKNKGEYTTNIKEYGVTIPTANMDINDCLENNLVDPREGGQPKKINLSLSYAPENPVNDPTEDNMGDVVVAFATTDNASQDESQLYYEWVVEISPEGTYNPDAWVDITEELVDSGLVDGSIKGNGLSSLKFKLNLNPDNLEVDESTFKDDYFPDGIGYLRIKVTASENFSSGVSREGKTDVIIKVISTEEKINAYTVGVDDSGKLIIDESYEPICQNPDTGERMPLCFLLKDEIIGVKIDNSDEELDNFSWTINGDLLNCNTSISDLCDDEQQTNYNFFPTTGNVGDTYTIGLKANNVTTGKTINLVRAFQIVDPFVRIISTDESAVWPRYLGDYIDLDGNRFADNSDVVFEMYEGSAPKLEAEFHPSWLADYLDDGFLQLEWAVDGVKQDNFDNLAELSLPSSDKESGSVYNISIVSVLNQSPETRMALKNIWGISQFDTTEEYMSHAIQIEVFAPEEEALTLKNSGKFLAGLLSYLPSQITFLFRILLTIVVIIVTAGIVFSLTPEPSYENKKTI